MEEPQETLVHADLPLDVMQVRGPALAASELPAGGCCAAPQAPVKAQTASCIPESFNGCAVACADRALGAR